MWNYRIGTKVQKVKLDKKTVYKERLFFIFECYYNENKIPNGYPEKIDKLKFPNPLANWTTMKDLKGTYKLIEKAFDKPIIDLDNWPNEYKNKK